MNHAPRWEYQSANAPIALAAHPEGIAALLDDGSIALLRADGSEAGALRVSASSAGNHGASAKKPAAKAAHGHAVNNNNGNHHESAFAPHAEMRWVVDGWLAAVPGETSLVRQAHATGRTLRVAHGDTNISSFAVSGEQVAIARHDGLELWTLADQRRWRVSGAAFVAVAFAGRTLVAIRGDGEIVFVSLLKGAEQGTLKLAAPEPVPSWRLASIDAARVAISLGEWLVIVDGASQKVVRRTRARGPIVSLAATDKRVVVGIADGWVQAFDAFTGEARGAIEAHGEPVTCVTTAGTSIVSATKQSSLVRSWDESALQATARGGAPVTALAARGPLVAVGDRSGRLRLLKGVEEMSSIRLDGAIGGVHIAETETVTGATGSVLVRLAKPWKLPQPILLSAPSTAFAIDDAYAFSGSESGTVDVFELARGSLVTSYALSEAGITALLRLPGAKLVVGTGALDGRLFVVDVAEAKVVFRIEAHQEAFGVTALAAEPRGRLVASGSDDGRVALIDPAKGRVLAHVTLSETPVSLAFDATGRKLAAALADGSSVVIFLDRRAAVTPLPYRGVTRVAWGDTLLLGMAEGPVERCERLPAGAADEGAKVPAKAGTKNPAARP